MWVECGSKKTGGLKVANQEVKVFANLKNPAICVIELYKNFKSLRPVNAPDAFYLQPLRKPLPDHWYQPRPVGHNPLSETIKKLCRRVKGRRNIRLAMKLAVKN